MSTATPGVVFSTRMHPVHFYGMEVPAGVLRIEERRLLLTDQVEVAWATGERPKALLAHRMVFEESEWPTNDDLAALQVAMRLSTC